MISPILLFDFTDLFDYTDDNSRQSGINRCYQL